MVSLHTGDPMVQDENDRKRQRQECNIARAKKQAEVATKQRIAVASRRAAQKVSAATDAHINLASPPSGTAASYASSLSSSLPPLLRSRNSNVVLPGSSGAIPAASVLGLPPPSGSRRGRCSNAACLLSRLPLSHQSRGQVGKYG